MYCNEKGKEGGGGEIEIVAELGESMTAETLKTL